MKKKMVTGFISLIVFVIVILTAGSFYFYHVAIARASKDFLSDNPDLKTSPELEESKETRRADKEWWNNQSFERWEMDSDDGIHLKAYYLSASKPSDKTVIIAHGYSGNATQMSSYARMYHDKLGYNILLPDARGHGESEGHYIGFGWPERKDYLKWIQRVLDANGTNSQIVLHGVSMGGATVMMTSGEDLPPNVKAIVEDCGYTSVKDQLSFQLRRMYHLPAFPIVDTTSLLTRLRAGYFFGEASALEQVKKSKTPTLFIHGANDTFVPTEMVHKVYENCPAEKELYIVPKAGHGEAYRMDRETYEKTVSGFIGRFVT
ncbi:alpha/beta hydrolase [Paenibacillus thiaminolyticus]|uniref:alpha/beta hydrolase n=1 Tax=Paenibacillus thiaminolyticus TaxID=49283 RepID=UPI0023505B78|nr:alpha/beta hydrolase [Paenibacillus thiaminolyticus]WCR28632.1 alpha/beta hydrolase [Paenibacillus thiaminolyticus]